MPRCLATLWMLAFSFGSAASCGHASAGTKADNTPTKLEKKEPETRKEKKPLPRSSVAFRLTDQWALQIEVLAAEDICISVEDRFAAVKVQPLPQRCFEASRTIQKWDLGSIKRPTFQQGSKRVDVDQEEEVSPQERELPAAQLILRMTSSFERSAIHVISEPTTKTYLETLAEVSPCKNPSEEDKDELLLTFVDMSEFQVLAGRIFLLRQQPSVALEKWLSNVAAHDFVDSTVETPVFVDLRNQGTAIPSSTIQQGWLLLRGDWESALAKKTKFGSRERWKLASDLLWLLFDRLPGSTSDKSFLKWLALQTSPQHIAILQEAYRVHRQQPPVSENIDISSFPAALVMECERARLKDPASAKLLKQRYLCPNRFASSGDQEAERAFLESSRINWTQPGAIAFDQCLEKHQVHAASNNTISLGDFLRLADYKYVSGPYAGTYVWKEKGGKRVLFELRAVAGEVVPLFARPQSTFQLEGLTKKKKRYRFSMKRASGARVRRFVSIRNEDLKRNPVDFRILSNSVTD